MAEYLAEDLSAEVQAKMDELAQKGNQLEKQGRFTEAVQAWQAGLALIPEPQQFYGQTVWFLAAIGDVYFQQGEYALAHECFEGKDIFEPDDDGADDGAKYFEFLRTHIDLGLENDY